MEKNVALVRKGSIFTFSVVLLLSTVVAVRSINLVSANGIIPPPINQIFIRSNGTVTPSTAPISADRTPVPGCPELILC